MLFLNGVSYNKRARIYIRSVHSWLSIFQHTREFKNKGRFFPSRCFLASLNLLFSRFLAMVSFFKRYLYISKDRCKNLSLSRKFLQRNFTDKEYMLPSKQRKKHLNKYWVYCLMQMLSDFQNIHIDKKLSYKK